MASAVPTPNRATPTSQPPPAGTTPASPPNKRDLKSWWKNFKLPSKHQEPTVENKAPGIFGIPLRQSITYANVAISLIDENGQSYIYGYVPIVVAKCGVFLKEKATSVEGIFRLSGSEKRIKELKSIFDSPDRYGKGLVWDGYTVHDAANVLRRYLNDLPEPVVPLDLYEKFRDPLRGATKQAVGDTEGPQFVDNFNEMAAIERYQQLITELPPLNRQLLLYILDLLAVFAAKSDENRMNSQNLAAIFQPGMLSHPSHAMAPEEYRLNQCVLIFLIENQDHFLIGMQGTAADEKTMKEVASGTPTVPVTPVPNKSTLDRSSSNASAGATSVRRDGQVRRNRSVSSRHSRQEGSATPTSPVLATTPTSGLGRSNTVPSKKSPAIAGAKFKRGDGTGHQSPVHVEPMTPVRASQLSNMEAHSTPTSVSLSTTIVTGQTNQASMPGVSQERLLDVPETAVSTPKERNLQSLFQRSPADGGEKRQPNKLKKKRLPGGLNASAQSSSASLTHSNASPSMEVPNPMETMQPIPEPPTQSTSEETSQPPAETSASPPQQRAESHLSPTAAGSSVQNTPVAHRANERSSEHTPRCSYVTPNNLHPDDVLRGKKSPPTSIHSSSFNEGSDLEQATDDQYAPTPESAEKEKKRRWRLSRSRKDDNSSSSMAATPPHLNIGSNDRAEISTTSIGSGLSRPRNSVTHDGSEPTTLASTEGHIVHEWGREPSKDDVKGPIGWIRNKYREAKESAEQRRNKSPPADRSGSGVMPMPSAKSLDLKRDRVEDKRPEDKRIEGKRFEETQFEEKQPEEKRLEEKCPEQTKPEVDNTAAEPPQASQSGDATKEPTPKPLTTTEKGSSATVQAGESKSATTEMPEPVTKETAKSSGKEGEPVLEGQTRPSPENATDATTDAAAAAKTVSEPPKVE
ncbi:hypothetical protein HIM_07796 [Hirsutella minnesotensis 3608]|uniref:Rho-GAP domain-containing protein n=1 Tax=Hirsutella minnesotensis 3608 TaxID=1043627 RepID=A0A0F7ZYP9_9HYPO|nr:hypothetical protein HIM_07796 [Hirsutella minnesotensis 3608]